MTNAIPTAKADRLFMLDHGRMVKMGTHQGLMERNGVLTRLQKTNT